MSKCLRTLKGSDIRRYKNIVGKHIGGKLYVHRDYMFEVVPRMAYNYAVSEAEKHSFDFSCAMFSLNSMNKIRLDIVEGFDALREPYVREFLRVDMLTGETEHRVAGENYAVSIWHHKWMWVKDSYTGFDVEESFEWSRKWLSLLEGIASGHPLKWEKQLEKIGLK